MYVCVGGFCVDSGAVIRSKGKGGSGGGGGGSTGCATVVAPTVSASSAPTGGSVGVFSRVTPIVRRVREGTPLWCLRCRVEETVIASNLISFSGGESKLISVPYLVAPDTCKGGSSVFCERLCRQYVISQSINPIDHRARRAIQRETGGHGVPPLQLHHQCSM